jgi:hypothetical protein
MGAELRDGQASGRVARYCSPVADGVPCGDNMYGEGAMCRRGVCTNKDGGPLQYRPLPPNPVPSAAMLGGNVLLGALPDLVAAKEAGPRGDSNDAGANGGVAPPRGVFTVDIDASAPLGAVIPHGFLGTSNEWTRVQDYDDSKAWARLFKLIGPGNIMRVGGASQDDLTQVRAFLCSLAFFVSRRQLCTLSTTTHNTTTTTTDA